MVSTVYWLNAWLLAAGALPAASRTLARFRVIRWLVVRASLAVGVKVAVQVVPSVPTGVRSPSVPLAWDRSMVSFVRPASLIVTATWGGLVSMLKLPLLLVPTPALSRASRTPARFTPMVLSALSMPDPGVYLALHTFPSLPTAVKAPSVPLLVSY